MPQYFSELYWRDASLNTLVYSIGVMHLSTDKLTVEMDCCFLLQGRLLRTGNVVSSPSAKMACCSTLMVGVARDMWLSH